MFKPEIGTCSKCGIDNKEIWPEYGSLCDGCFHEDSKSRFQIDGIPLVRIVEDILMERPEVKKIVEHAMVDYGVHRILKLENDGFIYMAEEEKPVIDGGACKATIAAIGVKKLNQPDQRKGVHNADPELIPKLNKMIDKHLETCDFCQSVIKSE